MLSITNFLFESGMQPQQQKQGMSTGAKVGLGLAGAAGAAGSIIGGKLLVDRAGGWDAVKNMYHSGGVGSTARLLWNGKEATLEGGNHTALNSSNSANPDKGAVPGATNIGNQPANPTTGTGSTITSQPQGFVRSQESPGDSGASTDQITPGRNIQGDVEDTEYTDANGHRMMI